MSRRIDSALEKQESQDKPDLSHDFQHIKDIPSILSVFKLILI